MAKKLSLEIAIDNPFRNAWLGVIVKIVRTGFPSSISPERGWPTSVLSRQIGCWRILTPWICPVSTGISSSSEGLISERERSRNFWKQVWPS
jgi:hypothetical protein